jgi:hypothetical protein
MSKLITLFCLVLSTSVFAGNLEEANDLYSRRGEVKENSRKAATIFKDLASNESNKKAKAMLQLGQAKSLYYFGGKVSSKDQKKSVYSEAYTAAKQAIAALSSSKGVPAVGVENADLAYAHYMYSINLARWGQANGISSSIRKLPELVENLELVNKLDETVESYGAYRTLGRTKFKVPSSLARLMGLSNFSTEDALEDLFVAYDETIMYVEDLGLEISKDSTTTLYLLDVLADLEEKGDFCDIFRSVKEISSKGDALITKLYPNRIPETKENFKNILACAADEDNCDAADIQSGDDFTDMAKSCR